MMYPEDEAAYRRSSTDKDSTTELKERSPTKPWHIVAGVALGALGVTGAIGGLEVVERASEVTAETAIVNAIPGDGYESIIDRGLKDLEIDPSTLDTRNAIYMLEDENGTTPDPGQRFAVSVAEKRNPHIGWLDSTTVRATTLPEDTLRGAAADIVFKDPPLLYEIDVEYLENETPTLKITPPQTH